jgi:SAM-dependent methyltransferase
MVPVVCKICASRATLYLDDLFDDRHGYRGRFQIYRCTRCGFGQTSPEIPQDQIADLYTHYYPRKNLSIEELNVRPLRMRSSFVRWCQGVNNTAHYHIPKRGRDTRRRVLDIGCGDCTSLREIELLGCEAHGIEPDGNVHGIAKTFNLKVHIGALSELPFPDNFFDYITMSQVLEHIHQPVMFLHSVMRVLKNDGQLIIGVPNIDSRLRRLYGKQWLNWHVPYHLGHFSRTSLYRLAERSGCKIVKLRTCTPNLWVDLQCRLAAYPVEEGKPVPFFHGVPEPNREHVVWARWKHRFRALRIPFLRLVDACRFGESFLVIFKKRT